MNRPLVYYAISIFIGCLASMVFESNIFLGAAIAASFLIVIFFTLCKKETAFVFLFFLCAVVSFYIYFNMPVTNSKYMKIRIVQNKDDFAVGKVKGRRIQIKGNIAQCKEGQVITGKGIFKEEKNYEKGYIGTFYLEEFRVNKKDFIAYLYEIKQNIYQQFLQQLGTEKTAFIMAICFGERKYLSIEQNKDFQLLGVIHAISVSGFHMAIIYQVLEKGIGLNLAILFSFLYLIFTGGEASTTRAFIMIFILKFSKKVFKNYDGLSSLSLSAILLLLFNPYFVADLGFTLSFLATLGILLYHKRINRVLYKFPKKIGEAISLTFSAQCFSMPYAILNFGTLSLGFLAGNLVLLPIYSIVVLLGNVALLWMKVPIVFRFFATLLSMIMNSIEWIEHCLLTITPPIQYLSYIDGIAFFLLYFSWVLVKYGYTTYKRAPLFIFIIVFFQNYSFFPQINYLNLQKEQAVLIRYHDKAVLLSSYGKYTVEEMERLKQSFKVEGIVTDFKAGENLKINGECKITRIVNQELHNNFFDFQITMGNSEILLIHPSKEVLKDGYLATPTALKDYLAITKVYSGYADITRSYSGTKYGIIKAPSFHWNKMQTVLAKDVEVYEVCWNKLYKVGNIQ